MPNPAALTQDRWQTVQIVMNGGLITNVDELAQARSNPGSLTIGQNFEAALAGGYRRLTGFAKYDTTAVTGTGSVLGIAVIPAINGVLALRNDKVFKSTGTGWTRLDATESANSFVVSAIVSAGGTVYAVNDVLTVTGGTHTVAATLVVTSVSGGVVTSVSVANPGRYTVVPTNPVSVTGGGGSLATFTLNTASLARSTPAKARYSRYNWGTEKVIFADNTNYPFTYDGSTYTVMDQAPKAMCVREHKNYMFYGKNNILTFSAPNAENDFDPADGAGEIDVGFDIINLYPWRDELYIFGTHRISKLSGTIFAGTTANATLSPVTNQIGLIGADSVQEIGGDLLFLAPDGLRTVAGTARINDVELGTITKTNNNQFSDFIRRYTSLNFSAGLVRSKNQYRIFASTSASNATTAEGWVVSARDQQSNGYTSTTDWEFYTTTNFIVSCMDSSYLGNEQELIVHGGFDGFVYQQEFGNSFAGANVPAILKLPANGFDDPELRKTFYKINVFAITEGTISVSGTYSFDFGNNPDIQPNPTIIASSASGFAVYDSLTSVYDTTTTYDANPNLYEITNTIGSGKNMSLVISSDDADAPYIIRSVILDYQVNGRR